MQALGGRDGVEAVVVLGDDGLPIDAQAGDGVDSESLAALVPPVVRACRELGDAARRGEFTSGVFEFGRGLAIVSVLKPTALLVVLLAHDTDAGGLLYDLGRHRAAIAGLF